MCTLNSHLDSDFIGHLFMSFAIPEVCIKGIVHTADFSKRFNSRSWSMAFLAWEAALERVSTSIAVPMMDRKPTVARFVKEEHFSRQALIVFLQLVLALWTVKRTTFDCLPT